ncbi:MAG: hypothetical protein D6797_06545 [Bdellovibrio sp.]|nr:MAG: hypothetical protein D6797_06545 [Bdellovibrio sp.]
MYFKWLLIVLIITSCARESEVKRPIRAVQAPGTECFKDTKETFRKYLSGKASRAAVIQFWQCGKKSLKAFLKYVSDDAEGVYKASYLRDFLNRFYLNSKDLELSAPLFEELMEVKRVFLGGSRKKILRSELEETISLIDQFMFISLELRPYMSVLSVSSSKVSSSRLQQALDKLDWSLKRVALLITQKGSEYSFSHMNQLFKQLVLYFESSTDWSKFVPILAKFKKAFIGNGETVVRNMDWEYVAKVVRVVYGDWLRLKYYVLTPYWYQEPQLKELDRGAEETFAYLEKVLEKKNISQEEIKDLLEAVQSSQVIDLDSQLVLHIWNISVKKFFADKMNSSPFDLTLEKLKGFKRTYRNWIDTQFLIVKKKDRSKSPLWSELKRAMNGPWTLVNDEKGRIRLDGKKVPYTPLSLGRLNVERLFIRLLIQTYAKDSQRKSQIIGLSLDELQEAFQDFKPLLVELGLVKPDDQDYYKTIFYYTNLFMPRSNGDKIVQYEEGIDYLRYIFSGIHQGEEIQKALQVACEEGVSELKGKGFPLACYREHILAGFSQFYENMPFLVSAIQRYKKENWYTFQKILFDVVSKRADRSFVTFSEHKKMVIFLHFLEVLFLRFDQNRDGVIGLKEAWKAFKLFKRFLERLLPNPEIAWPLFTYMLKYGYNPVTEGKAISELRFKNWQWKPESEWKIGADRLMVLRIIRSLSASL